MSAYELNRLLFDLKMSDALTDELAVQPDDVLRRYDLSAEEIDALRAQDPRRIRSLGAHGMLALYVLRTHPEFRDNVYWSQK
jgi:hypothetical protein